MILHCSSRLTSRPMNYAGLAYVDQEPIWKTYPAVESQNVIWRVRRRMRMSRAVCVFAFSLCWQAAAVAQLASRPVAPHRVSVSPRATAFEPLDRWKAAVISGDEPALAALYSTVPPAQTQTPRGSTEDAREEPRFWSALAASGLSDFQVKVLAVEHRQGGATEVVLRMGGKVRTNSGQHPFIVEMHQRWMREGRDWRIVATGRDDLAASPTMRLPEPAEPNISLYPPPDGARTEI